MYRFALPLGLAFALVLAPLTGYAHPGERGTDGCHEGSTLRHCHGPDGRQYDTVNVFIALGILTVSYISYYYIHQWLSDFSGERGEQVKVAPKPTAGAPKEVGGSDESAGGFTLEPALNGDLVFWRW